jgi:hypothetical protein
MEVVISGADKAQITGWTLLVEGVEVQNGKGRFPATLLYTFKDFPLKDPFVQLVVRIGLSDIETQSVLSIPQILKQRRFGKPVARLLVIPGPTNSGGVSLVSFDASGSFVTRGGSVSAWEIAFGDGTTQSGKGKPPSAIVHEYENVSSDRLIFLVSLTVYSEPELNNILASFPATLMAGVDPPGAQPSRPNALVLRFESTDGLGTAVFTTTDPVNVAPNVKTNAQTTKPQDGIRWELTAGGKRIEGGEGRTPQRIAHLFGSVAQKQRISLELVVEMPDGSKQTAALTVELIPTDGRSTPLVVQPEPVKTAGRRDDVDGEPVF